MSESNDDAKQINKDEITNVPTEKVERAESIQGENNTRIERSKCFS